MAYTPQLTYKSSCTLRRIAWALNLPMTKTIEQIFEHIPTIVDCQKVCFRCRDKSGCSECVFKRSGR